MNNNMKQSGSSDAETASHQTPSESTMRYAIRFAISEDKPIMMDYWTASLQKTALIGIKENKDKILVKSQDEYTSTIAKLYKQQNEYIILTENSIYIVSSEIPTRSIS
jgi:hypothetical protein